MKQNANVTLQSKRLQLIPYEAHHVLKYHNWMQDVNLQKLTASDPLSLEEEYGMQQRWRLDPDKCTFIILARELYNSSNGDEVASMIGDVNVFISEDEEQKTVCAELEVMIAEQHCQGKGFGMEACKMMIVFAYSELKISHFFAKIAADNLRSMKLFKHLGFCSAGFNAVFQEFTVRLNVCNETVNAWKTEITYERLSYSGMK